MAALLALLLWTSSQVQHTLSQSSIGNYGKTVLLTPSITQLDGAQIITAHNEVYTTTNNGWGVLINSQSTWQFILILDNTWAFHPIFDSVIEITIDSDYRATGHGPDTFNELLFGFTVDNA